MDDLFKALEFEYEELQSALQSLREKRNLKKVKDKEFKEIN